MTEIPLQALPPVKFVECEFVAHLKEIRVITKGKIVVLEVPFDRMTLVNSLETAIGVPLQVHCQVWKPVQVVDE